MCVGGCTQVDSLDWTRRVCESMLHVSGEAWYVGVVAGCCRVVPLCILTGAHERHPGVLRWSHLNWRNMEHGEGQDKRSRITMKEKSSLGRERAQPRLAVHRGK